MHVERSEIRQSSTKGTGSKSVWVILTTISIALAALFSYALLSAQGLLP